MILNLGRVAAGTTLYVPFHTFNSSGASVTLTGLAVTDIEIYKNGSTTQRASDNGYTLLDTDGIDFDGIAGIHGFSVDLSDNSDAGFYSAGGSYWIAVSAVTVDSQTVNFVAGIFSIEPAAGISANVVAISGDTTAADNLEFALDDTAGAVPWFGIVDQGTAQSASATGVVLRAAAAFDDDTLIGTTIAVFGSTQGFWQSRVITDNALSGDTVTVDTWTVTPSGTITYKIHGSAPGSVSIPAAVNVTQIAGAAVNTAAAQLGVNVVTVAANAITATAIAADAITDAKVASDVTIASVTGAVGSVTGAVGSVTGNVGGNVTGSVGSVVGAVGSVTGNVGGNVTGSVGSVASGGISAASLAADTITAAKVAADVTTELQSGLATAANLATVAGYIDTEVASILAAVDTEVAAILALLDDARSEPAQGAPPVNPDLATKIDYLYKAFRNRITQTATTLSIYADDATTVDHKATVSDDGSTYSRGELAAGP